MSTTRSILAVLAVALGATTTPARTASDFFVSAPDKVIRLLPQATRLDMLDYHRYGSDRPSNNQFNGQAILRAEYDATVEFDVDKDISMQIAVIPAGSDTVVALVTTYRLPVPDSSVEFFDRDWNPRTKGVPSAPAYSDWLTTDARKSSDKVEIELPFIPATASFNDDATTLTFTNEAAGYLDKETNARLQPLLIGSIIYDIAGGHFKQRK